MIPPASPWTRTTKDVQDSKSTNQPSGKGPSKGLQSSQSAATIGPSLDYAQKQDEEVDVLRAIYMDDFEEVDVKPAWMVSAVRVCPNRSKKST